MALNSRSARVGMVREGGICDMTQCSTQVLVQRLGARAVGWTFRGRQKLVVPHAIFQPQ